MLVIGGGFAGATLVQHLERNLPANYDVRVISTDNHLVFTPMLPEVAARTVSPFHVVVAGRQMTKRTDWISGQALSVDVKNRVVECRLSDGTIRLIPYTHLVFACGQTVDFSSIPGLQAHAYPLKSTADAFAIGNEVIGRFELASAAEDEATRRRLLTTVVIGGGFSGVEIAGHLGDLMDDLRPYYPKLANISPKVVLLQRGDRIIPELQHESLSVFACKKLRENGIDVRLKTAVSEVSARHVVLGTGERVEYGLLIGTIGNAPHRIILESGLPLERGRLKADPDMRVQGSDNVWALGDCAVVPNQFNQQMSPPTAQFALRQGKQLAHNIESAIAGKPTRPFRFRPQGLLASIGRRNGVAEIYGFQFSGMIAWFLWRNVYFWKTPTWSRRFGIAVDWMIDFLFPANIVRVGSVQVASLRREHYAKGDIVYHRGDPATSLFVIEKGKVAIDLGGTSGEVVLDEGDRFGASALESGEGRRSTTVTALESLDVVAMDREAIRALSGLLGVMGTELDRYLQPRRARVVLERATQADPTLASLRVRDLMRTDIRTVAPTDTLRDALAKMAGETPSLALMVVDAAGTFCGYCGRSEVTGALTHGVPMDTAVSEIMRRTLPTIKPDHTLLVATGEALRSDLEVVPVLENGRAVGTFSLPEAAQALVLRAGLPPAAAIPGTTSGSGSVTL